MATRKKRYDPDAILGLARSLRETSHGHGRDMPMVVVTEVGGGRDVTAMAPGPNRDAALEAARILRIGTGAEAVTLVIDSYARQLTPPPGLSDDERAAWRRARADEYRGEGSMQRAVRAGRRGDIVDAVLVVRATLDGVTGVASLPYRAAPGSPVEWIVDPDDRPPTLKTAAGGELREVGGRVVEALTEVMASPHCGDPESFDHRVARAISGVTAERGWELGRPAAELMLRLLGFRVVTPDAGG